ncbi:MAG: hypothetical protein J2P40_13085 [Candidatus Dormibacteraeota bacterium]|nr:hypothetical protein [Candidatus Dormibacteraeota bacterium]MBO0762202.1 hypothetical protein [Candidatus Dormibacteraeota bacterium]
MDGLRDYVLVEFAGNRFPVDLVPDLRELVDRGTIRILDLVVVRKHASGELSWFELETADPTEAVPLAELRGWLVGSLTEDDVAGMTSGLACGSSAGLLVWENTWASPLGEAIHRAGGRVVARGRLPALVGDAAEDPPRPRRKPDPAADSTGTR